MAFISRVSMSAERMSRRFVPARASVTTSRASGCAPRSWRRRRGRNFIKLTGPARTIDSAGAAFAQFLQSLTFK